MVNGDRPEALDASAATPAATSAAAAGTNDAADEPGHAHASPIAARGAPALDDQREDLRFDALRNALYHQSRRSFSDGVHRWQMFIVIMSGSGAVASLAAASHLLTAALSLLAATSAAADVAFDWAGKTRENSYLARRYYEVLAEVEEGCETIEDCRRLKAEIARLYGEERPPMRAVDAVAYNAAQVSLYGDAAKRVRVTKWQSWTRHFIPFASEGFPTDKSTGVVV